MPLAWPVLGLIAAITAGVLALETHGLADDQAGGPELDQRRLLLVQEPAPGVEVKLPGETIILLARPLFRRTRRPTVDPTASAIHSPGALPRLTGIVVASPSVRSAIFVDPKGDKPIAAGEGDRVGGAIIETIAVGQVTMRGPAGVVVLHPTFDENAGRAKRHDSTAAAKTEFQPRAISLPANNSW